MSIAKNLIIIAFMLLTSSAYGLTIKAVGDIMLQSGNSHLPQNYFHSIHQELSDADITFGNYEGTICKTNETSWKCKKGKSCYAFKSQPSVVDQLLNVGFDIMSIANNHIYDYGEYCANETQKNLEQSGIAAIGLMPTKKSSDLTSTRVLNISGLRVGFVAFHYSNGWGRLISIKEFKRASKLIKLIKKETDLVVISFHGGDEGSKALNVGFGPEKHYSTGEKRGDLRKFSRAAVDAGADLVLGHGPHVPRGMELYKNKLIAYSLSNFATLTGFSLRTPMHLGLILEVTLDERTGNFKAGRIIPTKQSKKPVSIVIDKNNEAVELIKRLTNEDFDSPLRIDSNGFLSIKN